jgi:hypothetical protein
VRDRLLAGIGEECVRPLPEAGQQRRADVVRMLPCAVGFRKAGPVRERRSALWVSRTGAPKTSEAAKKSVYFCVPGGCAWTNSSCAGSGLPPPFYNYGYA